MKWMPPRERNFIVRDSSPERSRPVPGNDRAGSFSRRSTIPSPIPSPPVPDTFNIVTAEETLTGAFSNVASGERLVTADGLGSFIVSYATGLSVVLSDFEIEDTPVAPNPPMISDIGGMMFEISWDAGNGGVLQRSTDLIHWENLPDANSPLTTSPPAGGREFYRLTFGAQ